MAAWAESDFEGVLIVLSVSLSFVSTKANFTIVPVCDGM